MKIRQLLVLARRQGYPQLEGAIYRDYDSKRPVCPICGHNSPLAHIHFEFFEDVIVAERSSSGSGVAHQHARASPHSGQGCRCEAH